MGHAAKTKLFNVPFMEILHMATKTTRSTVTPNYNVSIGIELYDNSTKTKFDNFVDSMSGQNIQHLKSRGDSQSRNYSFSCTPYGVAILLSRWTKRLGTGMKDAVVTVAPSAAR